MMGKRLHLWRLSNFKIERVPSVEDVYLLHAIARDNPKDERLFAAAEVRDVTPVRDDAGRIVQLPHLERMLMEALAAIRLFQSRRRPQERLYWNRVFLVCLASTQSRSRTNCPTSCAGSCPRPKAWVWSRSSCALAFPIPPPANLRDLVVRISSPVGSGSAHHIPPRRQAAAAQTANRIRSESRSRAPARTGLPLRDHQDAHSRPGGRPRRVPPGDFVEYDLDADRRAGSASIVPTVRTRRTSSLESSATSQLDIPKE